MNVNTRVLRKTINVLLLENFSMLRCKPSEYIMSLIFYAKRWCGI